MRRLQIVYPEDSQIAKELHFLHTKNQETEFTEKTWQKTEMLQTKEGNGEEECYRYCI